MKSLRLLVCLQCLIHSAAIPVSYSSEISSEASANVVTTAISDFCRKYRSDLMTPQNNWKIAVTTTNGVAILPIPPSDEREVSLTVDLKQKEVTAFSAFKGFSKKRYGTQTKDIEAMVATRADAIRRDFAVNTNTLKPMYARKFHFAEQTQQKVIEYLWQRQTNGFAFKDDFVKVIYDAQDGELLSLRKSWGNLPDSLHVKLALPAAKEIVSKQIGNGVNAKALRVNSAEIAVVSPNDFLTETKSVPKGRRLAWVFELPKQFLLESSAELWVDSETGVILGGKALF